MPPKGPSLSPLSFGREPGCRVLAVPAAVALADWELALVDGTVASTGGRNGDVGRHDAEQADEDDPSH